MSIEPIQFFYLGPPKTGSTWLFRCLESHPQINASQKDEIYYYDRFYGRGPQWQNSQYTSANPVRVDCTPSYILNHAALRRAIDENPKARFAFGLRHPVERAFSSYWHVKRRGKLQWDFEDILTDYHAHQTFLESSWIAENIAYLQSRLPAEQIFALDFPRIGAEPEALIQEVFAFIGIDATHTPPMLHQKINAAGGRKTVINRVGDKVARLMFGTKAGRDVSAFEAFLSGKQELRKGIDPTLYAELLTLCEPEITHLETLLNRDLSAWRALPQLSGPEIKNKAA